jgi:uncharacterized integral membrane protein
MWILRWVVSAVIILVVLGFALQNTEETVTVVFLRGMWESQPLPVWVVIYLSFGAGVLFWLLASIFQVFQLKSEIRRMRRENSKLKNELDDLRNISIEEEPDVPTGSA